MIPVDSRDVLDEALNILREFAFRSNVRGRFVSLYLGLRRMRVAESGTLAELGSDHVTITSQIEQYLDRLYTKSHRPDPYVVLTAPFGGSTSADAPYSPISGTLVPPRSYPINTWRNNFGIQKGVGCPAEPDVIERLLDDPQRRLSCPHMALDMEGKHLCSLRNTAYRGEEHSIWLRHSDNGYQVVDLNHAAVFQEYLQPNDHSIPVFPLIGMLYGMAMPGVYPDRTQVGIPDFAVDFGFTHEQVDSLFDCNPQSELNSAIIMRVEDARTEEAWKFEMRVEDARTEGVRKFGVPKDDATSDNHLPDEPPDAVLNTGVGAEISIGRDLQSAGWNVLYRANQPGLGYDLEATRDGQTLYVEVKSSIAFADLVLQESEWQAAQTYGNNYVLAIVDFYGTDERRIWYVRNPLENAIPVERTSLTYRFVRRDIEPLQTESEFL